MKSRKGKHDSRTSDEARERKTLGNPLERFSRFATEVTGSTAAFTMAALVIVLWLACGPVFHFSDTWQLVINTGTTIITFLMVFLIQRSQNKDSRAIHLKLNELVAAVEGASNRLIDVEGLTEAELEVLHKHYRELVELTRKESSLMKSHSIEEAERRSSRKLHT